MKFRNLSSRTDHGTTERRMTGRNRLTPELLFLEDRWLMTMVIPVTSTADSGAGTLRAAVALADSASNPVKIDFELPLPATITLTSGQLELSNTAEPISIVGPAASQLAISGDDLGRVFDFDANVSATVSGLTLEDGAGSYHYGGGLDNAGTVLLEKVTITDCSGAGGSGLANTGTATLTDCTISNNQGGNGGGLLNDGTNAAMSINACTITGNVAGSGSGVRNILGGTLSVKDSTFSGNLGASTIETDGIEPGGPPSGSATLTGCTISGNQGDIEVRYSQMAIDDCVIVGTQDDAIFVDGSSFTVSGTTIADNVAAPDFNGTGGVDGFDSDLSFTGCTISGNSSASALTGGGLELNSCTLSMTGTTVSGNTAIYGGGLFMSGGTATFTRCTISGNTAVASSLPYFPVAGQGGGVFIAFGAQATITNSTIANNSAALEGGGIFNQGPANLSLVACTVSGNSAESLGGGLYNYTYGGGNAYAKLTDTIIAANTTPTGASDIAGVLANLVSGSYNLIGTGGSGGLTAANNLLNVANPGLTPLGDYGGPTETVALQPNSPAIHAGVAVTGVTTDQRGFPLASPPDIGAFQSHPGPLVVDTAIDGIGSSLGQLSLRQAVNLANVLNGGDAITFDKTAFAKAKTITLTDGPLEISKTTGPISITGTSAKKLTISGGGTSGIFQVDSGVSAALSNLTITGGVTAGNGGGLFNQGTTTLTNVVIAGNLALGDGGGVYNSGSLIASNLTVAGNLATDGGGVDNTGTAVILASSIDGNFAGADGGGIDNSGFLSLALTDLSANSAVDDGGGLFNSGTASLVFCTVDDNAASSGGGLFVDPSATPGVLVGTTVAGNKGGNIVGRVIRL